MKRKIDYNWVNFRGDELIANSLQLKARKLQIAVKAEGQSGKV